MLIAAPRTSLAGIPGVNCHHSYSPLLGFVSQKRTELSERPTMQATLVFTPTPTLTDAASNPGKVLNDKGCARGSTLNNAFGQNVIAILPEIVAVGLSIFSSDV